jgi:hypothetical protein
MASTVEIPGELVKRGPVVLLRILGMLDDFEDLAAEISELVALSEEAAGEADSLSYDWNEQTGVGAAHTLLVVMGDRARELSGSESCIYTPLSPTERRSHFGHLIPPGTTTGDRLAAMEERLEAAEGQRDQLLLAMRLIEAMTATAGELYKAKALPRPEIFDGK